MNKHIEKIAKNQNRGINQRQRPHRTLSFSKKIFGGEIDPGPHGPHGGPHGPPWGPSVVTALEFSRKNRISGEFSGKIRILGHFW